MLNCNVIRDAVLCVRRACQWREEECRWPMIPTKRSDDWREELRKNEDGEDEGMAWWWVIPVIIVLILALCCCCCCYYYKKDPQLKKKKDLEENDELERGGQPPAGGPPTQEQAAGGEPPTGQLQGGPPALEADGSGAGGGEEEEEEEGTHNSNNTSDGESAMTETIGPFPWPSPYEMLLHKPVFEARRTAFDALTAESSDDVRDSSPGENSSSDDVEISIVASVNDMYAVSEGEGDVDATLDQQESAPSELNETVYMEMTEPHADENGETEEPFEPGDEISVEQILAVSAVVTGEPSTSVCMSPGAAPTGEADRPNTSTPVPEPEEALVASPVEASPPDPGIVRGGVRFARRPSLVARERHERRAKKEMADKKYPK